MQCERRNQVEPRCAERWHLRDDEQFDLAAWFPSLKHSWSRVASFFIDTSKDIADLTLLGILPLWNLHVEIVAMGKDMGRHNLYAIAMERVEDILTEFGIDGS